MVLEALGPFPLLNQVLSRYFMDVGGNGDGGGDDGGNGDSDGGDNSDGDK